MSALALFRRGSNPSPVPAGLGEKLIWLRKFGKPRVGIYGTSDWHANIEMNTNSTGAAFEIRSEYKHQTPEAAVDQLIERILATLSKLPGAQA